MTRLKSHFKIRTTSQPASQRMDMGMPRNLASLRLPYSDAHMIRGISYDMIFEISHLQPNNHFLFSVGFQYFILLLFIWNLEVFY